MKVKIIKCSNPEWWYINKIGEEFEVKDVSPLVSRLIDEECYRYRETFISKEDCEVIEPSYFDNTDAERKAHDWVMGEWKRADPEYFRPNTSVWIGLTNAYLSGHKDGRISGFDLHKLLSDFYVHATNGEVCKYEVIDEFLQNSR